MQSKPEQLFSTNTPPLKFGRENKLKSAGFRIEKPSGCIWLRRGPYCSYFLYFVHILFIFLWHLCSYFFDIFVPISLTVLLNISLIFYKQLSPPRHHLHPDHDLGEPGKSWFRIYFSMQMIFSKLLICFPLIIQPRTFVHQTHLHIFQLLPQRIGEVTNFQHLMSWMIHNIVLSLWYAHLTKCFYRTQVYLGSDLWVRMTVC